MSISHRYSLVWLLPHEPTTFIHLNIWDWTFIVMICHKTLNLITYIFPCEHSFSLLNNIEDHQIFDEMAAKFLSRILLIQFLAIFSMWERCKKKLLLLASSASGDLVVGEKLFQHLTWNAKWRWTSSHLF